MITPSSERGLSEVLGAILMFALVFAVLVIIQVWAVPTANAQVEIDHAVALESDFGELSESFDRVTLQGVSETSSIQAGVRYPSRIFLINPPPASYTFSASETYDDGVSITNVAALDGQTQEYFSTRPTPGSLTFDTRTYSLSTDYAQYAQPPTYHVEGGSVYRLFENGEYTTIDSGDLVNGRTITLVALEGSVSTGGSGVLSLPMAARTGPMQTTSVTNAGPGNIVVSVPTTLETADWEAILASETDPNGYIVAGSIDVSNGILSFELVGGNTYDLRLSKVRIGQETVVPTEAAYITAPDGETNRRVTGASDFTVQVRDNFNNPVSGVDVTFSADIGEFESTGTGTVVVTSNDDGMATARYDPTDQNTVIKATIPGAASDEPDPKRVHFNVDYVGGRNTGDDGTNSPNPYTDNLVLVDTAVDGNVVEMTFANLATENKVITDARIAFFYNSKPGESDTPVTGRLTYDGTTSDPLIIGRDLGVLEDTVVEPGDAVTIEVEFFMDAAGTSSYGTPNADDFFVLNLLFEDTTTGTYFVHGTDSGLMLTQASAGNVGTSSSEQQTLQFKLGRTLNKDETVTIDLSNAQGSNDLDYKFATVSDNADGSVALDQSGQSATVTYTAEGTEKTGETITITVSDIDANKAISGTPYEVEFETSTGEVITTEFEVD